MGLPPQYYPTHSNAYYVSVTGGSFMEVSCMGVASVIPHLQKGNKPVPESVWHRDRPFPDERGGHGAHGSQLGHSRFRG